MEIIITQGDISSAEADCIILGVFEGVTKPAGAVGALNKLTDGQIVREVKDQEFKGKLLETLVLHNPEAIAVKYLILIGLGQEKDISLASIRKVAARASQKARELPATRIASVVHGSGIGGIDTKLAAEALTEGTILGSYQFNKYKSREREKLDRHILQSIQLFEIEREKITLIQEGVTRGQAIAQAIIAMRDLVNEPPTQVKPRTLAESAQEIAASSETISLQILDRYDLTKQGYNAILAVAAGSEEEPYLIHLHYKPNGVKRTRSIAFVGKGVTFDSGGLGIKPWSAMRTMKSDMAGAAVVLGIFQALAYLESVDMPIPVEVHGVIPSTENMISGKAMRPDDIIETKMGVTIEVAHTDAEGRLILADALTFATALKPHSIIDFATLTGAAIRALGRSISAYMGTDAELINLVRDASNISGELAWELPLHEPYRDYIKSSIADLQNVGKSDYSPDAIIGGLFLKEFIGDIPWVHIDIAGPSWQEEDSNPIYPKGGTGYGILLAITLLDKLAASSR